MLLQPFIENAIKHGLLHRNGDKRLSIHFRLISERRIECRIQDNGIGRDASRRIQENRNSEHRSFSTEAIDQKVQLVNESTSRKLHVEVKDLFDETVAIGTLVLIQIDF
jgi:sensor histidine kinase YesM